MRDVSNSSDPPLFVVEPFGQFENSMSAPDPGGRNETKVHRGRARYHLLEFAGGICGRLLCGEPHTPSPFPGHLVGKKEDIFSVPFVPMGVGSFCLLPGEHYRSGWIGPRLCLQSQSIGLGQSLTRHLVRDIADPDEARVIGSEVRVCER
jgi:hypothetical protein